MDEFESLPTDWIEKTLKKIGHHANASMIANGSPVVGAYCSFCRPLSDRKWRLPGRKGMPVETGIVRGLMGHVVREPMRELK